MLCVVFTANHCFAGILNLFIPFSVLLVSWCGITITGAPSFAQAMILLQHYSYHHASEPSLWIFTQPSWSKYLREGITRVVCGVGMGQDQATTLCLINSNTHPLTAPLPLYSKGKNRTALHELVSRWTSNAKTAPIEMKHPWVLINRLRKYVWLQRASPPAPLFKAHTCWL